MSSVCVGLLFLKFSNSVSTDFGFHHHLFCYSYVAPDVIHNASDVVDIFHVTTSVFGCLLMFLNVILFVSTFLDCKIPDSTG